MSNFLRPLYNDFVAGVEKLTSNSASIQEVNFSSSVMLIYTFENMKIKCEIIFNNVVNSTGVLTLSLQNFNTQIAVKSIDFLYCNNVQITSLNASIININTDTLINLNGIIKVEGY